MRFSKHSSSTAGLHQPSEGCTNREKQRSFPNLEPRSRWFHVLRIGWGNISNSLWCCVIYTRESHHLLLSQASAYGISLLRSGNSFLSQWVITSTLSSADAALVGGRWHNCWVTNGAAWLKASAGFTLAGSKACFYSLIAPALMFSICALTGHFQGCLSNINADLLERLLEEIFVPWWTKGRSTHTWV